MASSLAKLTSLMWFVLVSLMRVRSLEVCTAGAACLTTPNDEVDGTTNLLQTGYAMKSRQQEDEGEMFQGPTGEARTLKKLRMECPLHRAQGVTRNWTNSHFQTSLAKVKQVFYPFGGGDAFYPLTMFPGVDKVLIAGLEAPGHVEKCIDGKGGGALAPVELSGGSELQDMYHTRVMDFARLGWFNSRRWKRSGSIAKKEECGILPLLLGTFTLASCDSVEISRLASSNFEEGRPIYELLNVSSHQEADDAHSGQGDSVEIFARESSSGRTLSIVYKKLDIATDTGRVTMEQFLSEAPTVILLKSAMSVLSTHKDEAPWQETINTMLTKATMVVQDDSGLPVEALLQAETQRKNVWKMQLFGQFNTVWRCNGTCTAPKTDPGLQLLYTERAKDLEPVPFKFGYHENATMITLLPVQ